MFVRFTTVVSVIALAPVTSLHAQEAFPGGVWTDARNRIVVRVVPCDKDGGGVATSFCGTVVRDNRPGRAINPPGHEIIRGLVRQPTVHRTSSQSSSRWTGQAHDGPLRVNFTLHTTTDDTAKARLCLTGVFCLTETVHRVSAMVQR